MYIMYVHACSWARRAAKWQMQIFFIAVLCESHGPSETPKWYNHGRTSRSGSDAPAFLVGRRGTVEMVFLHLGLVWVSRHTCTWLVEDHVPLPQASRPRRR